MQVINTLQALSTRQQPLVMAAGFFDGVHRGHAKLLQQALAIAREHQGTAWALTFDPHPLQVLNPAAAPPMLTSREHKERLLRRQGLDGCLVLPFTRDLSLQEPEDFIQALVQAAPTLDAVCVGVNWRFGRDRRGDIMLLQTLADRHGFHVCVVEAACLDGSPISSTRVREAVQAGQLEAAESMLGRPFGLYGSVTQGKQLGRQLGYPTANVQINSEALPPYGIYAACADIDGQLVDGVVSFGVRPTFHRAADAPAVLEFHGFDTDGDLYGKTIEVFLIEHLRSEETFSSPEALKKQIALDVEQARDRLHRKKLKESLYTICRA
ncbi:MAG: bifunctional riboflavin kinase/FAD synthetase [Verrucomicrobia bacterium]|nr:bifunctional riboflavin kinase/FAD synthetase [Verrucomicrobiota bacterium]